MANNGKYYLYEDLSITTAEFGGNASGVTIDGCGHTINTTAPIFNTPNNITIKNITFTGSIVSGDHHDTKSGAFSILNHWGSSGWVKAYNLTLDVDISSTNISGSQHAAQLAIYAGSGSVFENILATGNLNLGLNTHAKHSGQGKEQIQEIGGIVGDVSGATFKNVVNKGNIIVGDGTNAMGLKINNGGIGGIVGVAGSNVTFESCFYEGAITIKDKTVISTDFYIGGIVGKMSGSSVKKSMNNGNISVSEDANTATRAHLGGLIGYANAFVNVENSVNKGNISSAKSISTSDPVGTIGGIIGYFDKGANFYLCRNNGNLSNSVDKYNIGGIAGWGKGDKAFSHCINNGNVSMTWKSANQAGAAGICGYSQTGTVSMYHCENSGAIKLTSGGGKNLYTGGLLGRSVNTAITVDYCKNTGEIVGCTTEKGYNPVGGLISGIQYNGSTTTDTLITISYSLNNGSVKGYIVGGIMGAVSNDNNNNVIGVKISHCINDTNGAVTGTSIAGGIAGSNTRDTSTTGGATYDIDNCVNKGTINTPNDTAAGILGYANRTFSLDNCLNEGAINAKWAGGVLGYILTNVNVSGCANLGNVTSVKSVGGIVATVGINNGTAYSATIKNCLNGQRNTTKGTIYASNSDGSDHATGGVVGYVQGDAILEGVINYGQVSAPAELEAAAKYMGGVLGISRGTIYAGYTVASAKTSNKVEGAKCWNYGTVVVNGIFNQNHVNPIGGLFGHAIKGAYITNCENVGEIQVNGTREAAKDNKGAIGGIIGTPADDNTTNRTIIKNSINRGRIYNNTTKSLNWFAGGIVGSLWDKTGQKVDIENCHNYGEIKNLYIMGGIIGRSYAPTALTLKDCTNNNTIVNDIDMKDQATGAKYASATGGIAGLILGTATVTNCDNFAEVKSIKQTSNAYVGGIVARTTNNITITGCDNDADITGNYRLGGIVGQVEKNAYITNCTNGTVANQKTVKMDTTSGDNCEIGGIAGYVAYSLIMSGCKNYAHIDNQSTSSNIAKFVGGLVGRVVGGTYIGSTVEEANFIIATWEDVLAKEKTYNDKKSAYDNDKTDAKKAEMDSAKTAFDNAIKAARETAVPATGAACVNYGNVDTSTYHSTNTQYTGGIIGLTRFGGQVANATNEGDITAHEAGGGTMSGIAGIVGVAADGSVILTIKNCHNEGAISSQTYTKYAAAGIIGRAFSSLVKLNVENCTNKAPIVGDTYAGGVAGYIEGGNTRFENCTNYATGAVTTKAAAARAGGIAGYITAAGYFEGCTNGAPVKTEANGGHIGGIAGYVAGTKTFISCTNNGEITGYKHKTGEMSGIGGILGYANGSTADLSYCVNTGKVTLTEGNDGYESRLGGMIGRVANNCAVEIEYCLNYGDIDASEATASGNHVGGIIGNIQTWNCPNTYKVVISNTVNYGEVSGYVAAGFVGFLYPDANNGSYNVGLEITESVNNGAVNGKGIAAGFVGAAMRSNSYVTVSDSANAGAINGSTAGGAIGRMDGIIATLTNIANIGEVSGSDVYGIAAEGNITNCISVGNGITASEALQALQGTNLVAFTTDVLDAAIDKAQNIIDTKDPNKYVIDTWNLMIEKLDAAKNFKQEKLSGFDSEILFVTNNDGSFSKILTQAEINVYERALTEAIDGLLTINLLLNNVNAMIADAEIIENNYYDGKVIYTSATWEEFMSALNALREAALLGDDLTWDIAKPAMAAMETATNNLIKGGVIYDADDFYALDGVDGTFTLAKDITISRPLGELKATILGNGMTITLDGCAIAQSVNGASITNFKVEGTAGEASSLLGAASGNVEVKGAIVNADAFTAAVIFDSVASSAEVTTYDIISYANAPLFMAGVKSEEVSIAGVLVMGEAEGLTDNDNNVEAELTYVSGVVYYDNDGEQTKSEAVFASGQVAYEMNENFKKYSSDYSIGEFSGTILTQKLDGTSLPTTNKESVDGSNVIVSDGKGGFVNLFTPVLPPVISNPDKDETPAELDFTALNAAIEAAKKLDASKYTEASMTVVKSYVSEAEAALGAKTQSAVDNATAKLNAVLAALEEKTEAAPAAKLDYTKLDEAIAKAAALKADGYSEGTWSILQTMIALANSAKKNALNQARIDQAVAGLDAAIAGLKAPVVEEAPVVDTNTDKTPEKEEDGCGSVVGGAAVIAVAIMALGAGVSFKKKED